MRSCVLFVVVCAIPIWGAITATASDIDFNRDVRPILTKSCTSCHGGVKQAGGVSFLQRQMALGKGDSGKPTVVPGNPDASELMVRVLLPSDDEDRMPPADHHPEPLSAEEIATLRRWIQQGAPWGEHWAYSPPQPPALPAVKHRAWPASRIDQFLLATMEAQGLEPSAPATGPEWLRRVSFALTGLPPGDDLVKLVDASLDDSTKEHVVDALLSTAAFGERWASVWMDVARYSDSMGYERDKLRTLWPYRDWLIRAFNADMPYQDFLVRQIAGDLLPQSDMDSHVATGFLRASQTNTEGGTDDEEFRIEATLERVGATWTAFQGVTFSCIQCHAHPYDPFGHKEFYQFVAFYNNLADCDLDSDFPTLQVPSDARQRAEALRLQEGIYRMNQEKNAAIAKRTSEIVWPPLRIGERWTNKSQVSLEEVDEGGRPVQVARGTPVQRSIYEFVGEATGTVEAIRIESLMEPGTSALTPSKAGVVSKFEVGIRREGNHAAGTNFEEVAVAHIVVDDPNGVIKEPQWGAFPNQFTDRWVVLILEKPLVLSASDRLAIKLHQNQGRDGAEPPVLRRIVLSTSDDASLRVLASAPERTAVIKSIADNVAALKKMGGAQTPVARERTFAPRQTAVFERGSFLNKGDLVEPTLPQLFGEFPGRMTRLEMATWMAGEGNPLTSRVWVNRVWAQLFGVGIVETLEDFGSTGTSPSHPELLDDLAIRFRSEMNGSLKQLVREIVLSTAYAQTANTTPERLAQDPRNRWVSRGPRNRLTAEMVRDHALAASGLLSSTLFGPSVMPPQPEGIWNTPYSNEKWKTSEGANRYRRGLYTFWRRSTPYPSFEIFDVPERKVCSPRRISTNTPLQALVTLNDPVFIEAARALAQRAMAAAPSDVPAQIRRCYEWVTTRLASEQDLSDFLALHEELLAEYRKDTAAAKKLAETPEAAAMTVLANTLLNLDSALTW